MHAVYCAVAPIEQPRVQSKKKSDRGTQRRCNTMGYTTSRQGRTKKEMLDKQTHKIHKQGTHGVLNNITYRPVEQNNTATHPHNTVKKNPSFPLLPVATAVTGLSLCLLDACS